MKTNDLAVRPLISPREAEKMILTFIYHGNHSRHDEMKEAPKRAIEKWFADNNEPLPRLISRCRYFFVASVPFVENFIGSTWTVVSDGAGKAKAAMTKGGKNEPEIEIEGSGTMGVDYESKFESACRARDKAIDGASTEELHTAIIKGIASIESYIAHRVDIWNRSLAAHTQLTHNKGAKVSFEEKIKVWVPTMSGGAKLNLSGAMWADFIFLQAIRDNDAVHAKRFAQGASFSNLASALNRFKTGIADLLLQLHVIFGEPVPRVVIRARFFPEVYVPKKTK
jgi:hypothetical protein